MEAAHDQVSATIGGKTRTISKLQATAMQLATKAASGDQAAIDKFLDWNIDRRVRHVAPSEIGYEAHEAFVLVVLMMAVQQRGTRIIRHEVDLDA
jgi:hypothetical protein